MDSKGYKWCAVPQCKNTSIKTPEKIFVFVPIKKTIRAEWLRLAKRDTSLIFPRTRLYFCEDHFDLPKDMENYMEYHLMGSVSQVRMNPGCIPTKFHCQSVRKKRASNDTQQPCILKKERKALIEEECEKDVEKITIKVELEEISPVNSVLQTHIENISQDAPKTANKATQVNLKCKFRSKAIQTEFNFVNQVTTPKKPFCNSVSTSPFKIKNCVTTKPSTSIVQKSKRKQLLIKKEFDCDISYT